MSIPPPALGVNERYTRPWSVPRPGTLQELWPRSIRGAVVELGAASGRNAALLPAGTPYFGLEVDDALAAEGVSKGLAIGLCDLDKPKDVQRQAEVLSGAETILALDVLEHLQDPRTTIRQVLALHPIAHRWIISVPNAVFLSARLEVCSGHFPRRTSGLFDETHRQFYDRQTLHSHLLAPFPDCSATVVGTALPVGGERLARWSATSRLVPVAERFAAWTARVRPQIFSYEWLAVVDVPT